MTYWLDKIKVIKPNKVLAWSDYITRIAITYVHTCNHAQLTLAVT